jgi:hypothetical protein
MENFKVRVRLYGREVMALVVAAESATEARNKVDEMGIQYKSVVSISIVK